MSSLTTWFSNGTRERGKGGYYGSVNCGVLRKRQANFRKIARNILPMKSESLVKNIKNS